MRPIVLGATLALAACTAPVALPGGDVDAGDAAQVPTVQSCEDPPATLEASREHARSCSLGDDNRSFARAAPYPRAVVEIGATRSAAPSQAAIAHLLGVMRDLLQKPGGITVVIDPPVDDIGHAMSVADAEAIEDSARTRFSLGDTAVVYYLIASESSTEDTVTNRVLGYAYRPSSVVVFQKNVLAVSGGIGEPSSDIVQSTVMAHELGHVLGLVNRGSAMQSPHEDGAHPRHDDSPDCIMYHSEISSAGLATALGPGRVLDFDAACRADIAALER